MYMSYRSESLYRSVKQRITDALRDGKWTHGQKIASEPQLAERYGASVGTVRRAVGELVAENILVREQGRGTFVVSHTPDYMLNAFFRIVDRAGQKELPIPAVFSMKRARADRETAQSLKLRLRAPVIEVERVLSLRGRPTILDRMRLPPAMFPHLSERIVGTLDGTVYGMFQQRFGITVVRTEEFITATIADDRQAELLDVASGTPLLRVARTAFTHRDQPVECRVRWIVSTHHGYLSVLGNT